MTLQRTLSLQLPAEAEFGYGSAFLGHPSKPELLFSYLVGGRSFLGRLSVVDGTVVTTKTQIGLLRDFLVRSDGRGLALGTHGLIELDPDLQVTRSLKRGIPSYSHRLMWVEPDLLVGIGDDRKMSTAIVDLGSFAVAATVRVGVADAMVDGPSGRLWCLFRAGVARPVRDGRPAKISHKLPVALWPLQIKEGIVATAAAKASGSTGVYAYPNDRLVLVDDELHIVAESGVPDAGPAIGQFSDGAIVVASGPPGHFRRRVFVLDPTSLEVRYRCRIDTQATLALCAGDDVVLVDHRNPNGLEIHRFH